MSGSARALWILRCLVSHWRRQPVQLATLIAGLAVATALWSGVQALNAEARQSYARAAALLGTEPSDRIEPQGAPTLPAAAYGALRRAGIEVSPLIEGRVVVAGQRLRIVGLDPFTMAPGPVAAALAEEGALGSFLTPPWRGLAAPETITLLGGAPAPLPPLAAADGLPPLTVVMDLAAAEALLGRGGALSAMTVAGVAPPRETLEAIAGVPLRVVRAGDGTDLARMTESFHLNLTAFGLLAFLVGIFIVHAAVGLAFEQRLGLYRLLRATGVSARELAAVSLAELMGLALVAGIIGTALGGAVAGMLLPNVAASLSGLYGAAVSSTLSLAPGWWLGGIAVSLLGAFVAGARGLLRLSRMPALPSARREAWARSGGRARRAEALAGLACLIGAGAALIFGASLEAGFAVMAGLLLGAALLLPSVLAAIAAVGARLAHGPLAEWFWADARQHASALGLGLMALMLALATNVGVGSMVGSFRLTFDDWLEQRLFADVYVRPADEAEAARMGVWLGARADVSAAPAYRQVETTVGGWPTRIVGRADNPNAAAYRENWPLLSTLPGAWDRVAAGEGAMLSEQLARRLGLGLGDALTLPSPAGPWPVDVVALYADYGNPKGEIGVGLGAFEARWPDAPHGGFSVVLAPGAEPGPLMTDLAAAFDPGPSRLTDQASVKALSQRIFEQTFAVTAALNTLTLGVAGVALFAGLAMLADMRLIGLAPIWAIGVTRRRLAWLELGRTVALAGLTALCALPLGIALAWVLVNVVNVQAFGWRLPLHHFPSDWAVLGGLALALAAAAGAVPALRLARIAPARLTKLFAEER